MKYFNQNYQDKLAVAIREIEKYSKAEIVVIARPLSESYLDCSLLTSGIFALLTFSYFIFSQVMFGDYLIFAGTLSAFLIVYLLTRSVNFLLRLVITNKRKQRSVEIMARAMFQKAGIHHTRESTGILIFISLLEKQVFLLPDRGLLNAVPIKEWERLSKEFQDIFRSSNPAEAFLAKLNDCRKLFGTFLPGAPNDINELPDNLEITI